MLVMSEHRSRHSSPNEPRPRFRDTKLARGAALAAVAGLAVVGLAKASEKQDYSQETKTELAENIRPGATRIANRMLRLVRSNRGNPEFQQMPAYEHPDQTTLYYSHPDEGEHVPYEHVEVTLGRTNGRPDPKKVKSVEVSRYYYDGEEIDFGTSVELHAPSNGVDFDGHEAWGAQRVTSFDEATAETMGRSGSSINTSNLLPYNFGSGSEYSRGETGRIITHDGEDLFAQIVADIPPAPSA